MTLQAITPYCTQADVEHQVSVLGVELRLDDDQDEIVGADEQLGMTDAIIEATETCNFYLWFKYAPEVLATSHWVNRAATILAVYALCGRRNNPVPDNVADKAAKIEDMLQAVADGPRMIPGVPLRFTLAPVMSNTRLVVWPYQFRCIRVERQTSSRHNRSQLRQNVDWQDAWNRDY